MDISDDLKFGFNFLIVTIFLLGLTFWLNQKFNVLELTQDFGQIIYIILFILIVSTIFSFGKIWQNFKYLAIWVGIFMFMLIGYSFRAEFYEIKERVLAELIPERGRQQNISKGLHSMSFVMADNGHFYIRAKVNGVPVRFLADTGASNIVLSPKCAQKLGFKLDQLEFNHFYETANGTVKGSWLRIADLTIKELHFKNIGASVNAAPMSNSLLGMNFFNRLKGYQVKNKVLTINY